MNLKPKVTQAGAIERAVDLAVKDIKESADGKVVSIQHPALIVGLLNYLELRYPVGGFLKAILENDLLTAVCKADPTSFSILKEITRLVNNFFPHEAHGSKAKVDTWLKGGGE
ncbi:MAG: hypothetical protein IIB77_05280 [Proteobacteria bacterium]|nr:hypothetical protein [Pseudomonadota bacterium]